MSVSVDRPNQAPKRGWFRLILIGTVLAAANLAVYLLLPPALLEHLGSFGYLGAFGSAALANATVIVPVPYYPLLIRLGQAMDPYGVTLAAAAGSVLGELVAFWVGKAGTATLEQTRFYHWVHRQLSHPWRAPLVLFALSAPPNPFFDVAGLLAGAVGVPVWIYVIATFLGRIVRMATVILIGRGL
ncbi:MAG: VTT domain-containing protein [Oscillochloris sp.]|nr:VTT domain-containing protein [Oscillochloris sp.]